MHPRMPKKLIAILVVALLLRLGLLISTGWDTTRAVAPDTPTYMQFAQAINNGNLWTYPSAERTPIYPMFLAIFHLKILPTVLAQIVLSLVTIYLTYYLAIFYLKNETIGLLAAGLLAVSLESITHTYYLLTETLFTFLFVASIAAFSQTRGRRALIWVAMSAVCMALAILTRPIALYYPIFMLLFLAWDQRPWHERLQKITLFSVVIILFVGGWMARNAYLIHVPTISTISAKNFLYYNAASLEADRTNQNENAVRKNLENQLYETLQTRQLEENQANVIALQSELAKSILLSDPLRYGFIHLKSDINSLLPDTDLLEILGIHTGQKGTLDYIKQHGLMAGIAYYFDGKFVALFILLPFILILCIIYAGSVIAIGKLIQQRKFYPLAVLSLPIIYGILLPGSPSNPRFRVPVMPFFAILAAYGLWVLWDWPKSRRNRKTQEIIPQS